MRLHDGMSSWGTAVTEPDGGAKACEGGPRHLLREVEEGLRYWEACGRPALFSFGMTVAREQQTLWCTSPDLGPYGS